MLIVGLTGGIGSGKSTVAGLLASHGAEVVDVDALGREIIAPGGAAVAPVLERFGEALRGADGGIDRGALAQIVFNDPDELAALNEISHPAINDLLDERIEAIAKRLSRMAKPWPEPPVSAANKSGRQQAPQREGPSVRATSEAGASDVVVLDMAVLAESTLGRGTRFPYELVVTVEAPPDIRLERLVGRGMTAEDAKARLASQATDEQRRELSNFVIGNGGGPDELAEAVAQLWDALRRLADERAA